jgi:hypothetical protein
MYCIHWLNVMGLSGTTLWLMPLGFSSLIAFD